MTTRGDSVVVAPTAGDAVECSGRGFPSTEFLLKSLENRLVFDQFKQKPSRDSEFGFFKVSRSRKAAILLLM